LGEQIILGLGNNIDYEIVWNSQVIESLIVEYGINSSEIGTDIPISSTREIVISILGFLKSGTGGERFVTSLDIILDFARLFHKKITMGGTSLRAAIAM
jgi:ADP-dependent phosphofructokinase/glucokinase